MSIPAKQATSPERFEVTAESFGPEGLIALAFPIEAQRERPRFDFLIQEPLGRPDAEKTKGLTPKTPFDELMRTAAFGTQTRGHPKANLNGTSNILRRMGDCSWRTKKAVTAASQRNETMTARRARSGDQLVV